MEIYPRPHEVERRIPILDDEKSKEAFYEGWERDWFMLTHVVLEKAKSNKDVQNTLKEFTSAAVSERLPFDVLSALSGIDTDISTLVSEKPDLMKTLSLPEVPPELIDTSLRKTQTIIDPEETYLEMMDRINDAKELVSAQKKWDRFLASGTFKTGISRAEAALIYKRMKMARDIKLLILAADFATSESLLENSKTHEDGIIKVELESGVVVGVADDVNADVVSDLFNPSKWESRRVLKDRVFSVMVNGKQYIMKERKTKTHMDVNAVPKEVDSISEFNAALDFHKNGRENFSDSTAEEIIKLDWERSLGYVKTPDGYQFAMFEVNEHLANMTGRDNKKESALAELKSGIIEHKDQFTHEYEALRILAPQNLDRDEVLEYTGKKRSAKETIESALGFKIGKLPELSYEDYATVKAVYLIIKGGELRSRAIEELGYLDGDISTDMLYVVDTSESVRLTVVGFDFEFFIKLPRISLEDEQWLKENRKAMGQDANTEFKRGTALEFPGMPKLTALQRAAFSALVRMNRDVIDDS